MLISIINNINKIFSDFMMKLPLIFKQQKSRNEVAVYFQKKIKIKMPKEMEETYIQLVIIRCGEASFCTQLFFYLLKIYSAIIYEKIFTKL